MFIPLTAKDLIYTTLSKLSLCVKLALLLCRVIQRWHAGVSLQCAHSARTWPLNSNGAANVFVPGGFAP